ncbi:MAG: hypothetical protein NC231_03940 [Bacillus sp. (in: Bacteria)]|nr:hypothetical protein [Bacillus sp. (in: firmicutes)]
MSDSDYEMLGNLLLQLDHEVRNSPEYHADNGISAPAVSVILNELYDALNERNTTLMRINQDMLSQVIFFGEIVTTKEDYEAMEKYQAREDGRTYIDFLPRMPHEQYLQVVEHFKDIGARFDPELKQWYVEADWKLPESEQAQTEQKQNFEQEKENETMETIDERQLAADVQAEIERTKATETYKAIYYDGSERKEAFADTKEAVLQAVQEATPGRKETDRCYVQERDAQSGEYHQEGIYLIESGRDVTPVEIKLPYMSKETFDTVKQEIKDMGAKFDGNRKMWYIERSTPQETFDSIQSSIDAKSQYKAIYYDGDTRREAYGATKEDAFQAVQEATPGRKETDRCYVQERDAQSGEYQQEGIYLIESGRDVTPVKLNMPYMSRETFDTVRQEIKDMGAKFDGDKKAWYVERSIGDDSIKQIQNHLEKHDEGVYLNLPKADTREEFKTQVEQLKQDGARYNPDKKAWYITEKEDRSKFTDYLPSDKPSIHDKLSSYTEQAALQNKLSQERTMEPKNKDTYERA